MQSTEPNILVNPLADPIANNFSVSSIVGSLGYSSPNTYTTMHANFIVVFKHVVSIIPISVSIIYVALP